jgi:hypothetical protein
MCTSLFGVLKLVSVLTHLATLHTHLATLCTQAVKAAAEKTDRDFPQFGIVTSPVLAGRLGLSILDVQLRTAGGATQTAPHVAQTYLHNL